MTARGKIIPSIGRIVHFTFSQAERDQISQGSDEARWNLGQSLTVPATIVSVHSDECVNLKVHIDGPGPDRWETSVPLKTDANDAGPYWQWPSMVGSGSKAEVAEDATKNG